MIVAQSPQGALLSLVHGCMRITRRLLSPTETERAEGRLRSSWVTRDFTLDFPFG